MKSIYNIVLEQIKQIEEVNEYDIKITEENGTVKFVHKLDDIIFENDEVANQIGEILQNNLVKNRCTDYVFYEDTDELNKIIKDEKASKAITDLISMSTKNDKYISNKNYSNLFEHLTTESMIYEMGA
ncbi:MULTISPECIES: hypothetical protein [Staphylococcus]|uniref:hypothetical protein n=1 Tax=Staphylococcus TaxID=1279 RepID=UPI000734B434|nr:hypothetical protein [Staphylococcus xylosus]KTW21271.1 hypothetical protein NS341_11095 [Staphylococcus xylosus]MCD8782935.1 hypothetical protein [Staphylococcus xylosus]